MGSQRCPVPAIRYSRVDFLIEVLHFRDCLYQEALRAGSCAAERYESRQV